MTKKRKEGYPSQTEPWPRRIGPDSKYLPLGTSDAAPGPGYKEDYEKATGRPYKAENEWWKPKGEDNC